jgi:hypothetical protein
MCESGSECHNRCRNEADCPCKSATCERHGICCKCIRYHLAKGGKPACMR